MCERIEYPLFELGLKSQIDELNTEWYEFIKQHNGSLAELYVSDGFYPYYTEQKIKILFIALEGRGLAGDDYIETIYKAYHKGFVGGKRLNQYQIHARMLRFAWGILHGSPLFDTLPNAEEIGKDFGTLTGISYAFMNLSKISNETECYSPDKKSKSIENFLSISSHHKSNLFAKEISILNPDLIIGMNHGVKYKYVGKLSNQHWFGSAQQVCLQKLTTDYGEYNLIDTFHFAAPKKNKIDFYDPIKEAIKTINSI